MENLRRAKNRLVLSEKLAIFGRETLKGFRRVLLDVKNDLIVFAKDVNIKEKKKTKKRLWNRLRRTLILLYDDLIPHVLNFSTKYKQIESFMYKKLLEHIKNCMDLHFLISIDSDTQKTKENDTFLTLEEMNLKYKVVPLDKK